MQALSETKKKNGARETRQPTLTEEQDSPTENSFAAGCIGLAQSKRDPDKQIQMSSIQSLVTLQGKPNSKYAGTKGEQLSAGEVDDFSLFQQPLEGALHQETDVNNTFHEINQSVDQVCQDDPDFQSILSNRLQARPQMNQTQTEAEKTAQAALLQKASDQEAFSDFTSDESDQGQVENGALTKSGVQNDIEQTDPYAQAAASSVKMSATEASKTARMRQKVSFMAANGSVAQERTAKSSTRQKRPPISFALPTFSNEQNSQPPQFEIDQSESSNMQDRGQRESGIEHTQMMQQLQPKLRINLKNLPSNSGGSSSYSNKDLSERLQGIIRQRTTPLTSGVSPTLQRSFVKQWPNEGLDMDSSNRTGTERDDPMLMSGPQRASPLHTTFNQNNSNVPPMPANLSQDPYFYLQWRQQTHKSCRSAHPNHQASSHLLAQRKAASPGTNAHTLRLNQGLKGRNEKTAGKGQVNDSASSYSNSSQTTVPVKNLTEVKNPSNLITFRFVNRKVTQLKEISRFRNLTELDVNGNLLQSEVPELINLPFLKKLNLSSNQIREMWPLPKTLEILNISYNCLKKLDVSVMRSLSNLTTLEVSNNGMESLEGLEYVCRLKRLIARNNQVQSLEPVQSLNLLIEMDLENNPIDSALQVLKVVQNKKDILIMNLKLAPLMVKIQSYEEFINSVGCPASDGDLTGKLVQDFKQLLTFLHNGTFYRRRKIFLRIRQQQQTLHIAEHRFSNFSNDEDSSNGVTQQQNTQRGGGAFSNLKQNLSGSGSGNKPNRRANDKLPGNLVRNQRTNSTGQFSQNKKVATAKANVAAQRSQRYEAIISLYDKLLEDEDKLLLQKRKKEARERKLLRQKLHDEGQQALVAEQDKDGLSEEEEDLEDASLDLDNDDDDDLDEEFLSDEFNDHIEDHQSYLDEPGDEDLTKGVDLDDLQTYHNQHFGVELNASTADFNKEIKQINQQLLSEGHLDEPASAKPTKGAAVPPELPSQSKEEVVGSKERFTCTLKQQESVSCSDQIDTQEISVVVPREERSSRYTNRQHHIPSSTCKGLESSVVRSTDILDEVNSERPQSKRNIDVNESQAVKSVSSKKTVQPSFKLDLAKLKNPHAPLKHADSSSNAHGSITAGPPEEIKRVAQVKITPGESMRNKPNQVLLMSVRMFQNQVALSQISERIPIKKTQHKSPKAFTPGDMSYQSMQVLETSYQSAQVGKKTKTMSLQQKQVHIPKLALQNIHRQPSEQSRHSNQAAQDSSQWKQMQAQTVKTVQTHTEKFSLPKSLKVLNLSKREDSATSRDCKPQQQALTLKQSQVTKVLQGKELLELYETVDHQRKIINECKRVLGDNTMTDNSVVERITTLQEAQRALQNDHACKVALQMERHSMQVEDLQAQIQRLLEQLALQGTQTSLPIANFKPLSDYNFLDNLEKINKNQSLDSVKPRLKVDGTGEPSGGLTMRLKDIRAADKTGLTGQCTAEQLAILELLNQSSASTTGPKPQNQSSGQGQLIRIHQNNHQAQDSQRNRIQQSTSMVHHGRSSSKHAHKSSGRHTRRDSGHQTLELSSKREYLDLCASPTAVGTHMEDNTLERASNQDDIFGPAIGAIERDKQAYISDFNPTSKDHIIGNDSVRVQQQSSQEQRENSFRRVGFFLEKIKERNSSLQERLNLSFKKSSRLDNSCISYRPTTSMANQRNKLKGTLVERDCISLTRDSGDGTQKAKLSSLCKAIESFASQQKTPKIVNKQAEKGTESLVKESEHIPCAFDGRKPQIVRQLPNNNQTAAPQTKTNQTRQKKETSIQNAISPTNNYIDFLQTAMMIERPSTTKAIPAGSSQIDQMNTSYAQHQRSALSVLEGSNQQLRECSSKLQSKQSTNLADQSQQGPLFNFYQCTEVLHQLSTTSRGNNAHSSKNRSFIQRGSGDCLLKQQQQQQQQPPSAKYEYSSLLKQHSKMAILPQQNALEHHTSVEVIKLGNAIIQRASSLEMVPRMTTVKSITSKAQCSTNGPAGKVSQKNTLTQYHHQGSRSGSQSFWTQTQTIKGRFPSSNKDGSQSRYRK